MILTFLLVAHLNQPVLNGITLDNTRAQITEPRDIEPALGYNMIQGQYSVTLTRPAMPTVAAHLHPSNCHWIAPLQPQYKYCGGIQLHLAHVTIVKTWN